MTLAFGAAILLLLLGVGVGAVVYQRMDTARRQLQADNRVREVIEQQRQRVGQAKIAAEAKDGWKRLKNLHRGLAEKGAVTELNNPDAWQRKIDVVADHWSRAKALSESGKIKVPNELDVQLRDLARQLRTMQRIKDQAVALNKIREAKSVTKEGLVESLALRDYPIVFRNAGLDVSKHPPEELGRKIRQSLISDQWVAALVDWFLASAYLGKTDPQTRKFQVRLISIAGQAEVEEIPKKLYSVNFLTNEDLRKEYALELLEDRAKFNRLSPQTHHLVGAFLRNRHRELAVRWLREAQKIHPTDFWISLELGRRLWGKGLPSGHPDLAEAAGHFRTALAIRPNSHMTWTNLASVYSFQKKNADAIFAAQRALELVPDLKFALWNLSAGLIGAGKIDEAMRVCRKAVNLYPKSKESWGNLGVAFMEQNKLDEAMKAYRKSLDIDNRYTVIWSNVGVLHLKKQRPMEAKKAFEKALESDPTDASALDGIGIVLCDHLKQYSEAEQFFRKALSVDPNQAPGWENLGNALRQQKKWHDAMAAYKKSIEIDPKRPTAWSSFGLVYQAQNDFEKALAAHKKATEIDPESAEAWNGLGTLQCNNLRQYKEAEKSFRKAIALDPEKSIRWENLGNSLSHQKKFDQAILAYKKAIGLDPKSSELLLNLAMVYQAQGAYKEALPIHKKATEVDPKSTKVWNYLGCLQCDHLGQYKEAEKSFRQVIALSPTKSISWENLGNALYHQKKLKEALEVYKKALNINPKSIVAWKNVGELHAKLEELDEAVQAYQKLVKLNERDKQSWYALGRVFRQQRNINAAVASYQKALLIDSQYKEAWRSLGVVQCDDLRKYAQAEESFRKVIAIAPKEAQGWGNLAMALRRQQKYKEATTAYRKSVQLDPNYARAWGGLGATQRARGKLEESIQAYNKYLTLRPRSIPYYSKLGQVLVESGNFREAQSTFGRALKLLPANHPATNHFRQRVGVCNRLLMLKEELPKVLEGKKIVVPAKRLELAVFCEKFTKQYREATKLCVSAFRQEPKLADDLRRGYRKNAVRVALLAAFEVDDLGAAREATALRQQALSWMCDELETYKRLVDKGPLNPLLVRNSLKEIQEAAIFVKVKGDLLDRLPKPEQPMWKKFWTDVNKLRQDTEKRFDEKKVQGVLTAEDDMVNGRFFHDHKLKLEAGQQCVIEAQSEDFNSYLLVLDPTQKKQLFKHDDIIPARNENSRVIWAAKRRGAYVIRITTSRPGEIGIYQLQIVSMCK